MTLKNKMSFKFENDVSQIRARLSDSSQDRLNGAIEKRARAAYPISFYQEPPEVERDSLSGSSESYPICPCRLNSFPQRRENDENRRPE